MQAEAIIEDKTYMRKWNLPILLQLMAWRMTGAKLWPEPMLNWTLGKQRQWNRTRNLYIFMKENEIENVVWKISAILSRP